MVGGAWISAFPPIPWEEFPFLFFGEEILVALHLFTWGYDGYHCHPHVAVHCWDRGYRPGWREVVGGGEGEGQGEREGKERVGRIARGEVQVDWLGGRVRGGRGVKEFWERVGVDPITRQITERARTGGVDPQLFTQQARPAMTAAVLSRVLAFAGSQ